MKHIIIQLIFLYSTSLFSHSIKATYLEIKTINTYKYQVKFKMPTQNKLNPKDITFSFPKYCQKDITNTYAYKTDYYTFQYYVLICSQSIKGKNITIQNFKKINTDILFSFYETNSTYPSFSTIKTNIFKIEKPDSNLKIIQDYLLLGIEHILRGIDHLFFIVCLLFIVSTFKDIFKIIILFTLAHSITLVASTLGYININTIFIEMLIMLSIIILASEILNSSKNKRGLSTQYPWLVTFFFGLIHGLGFASVLKELISSNNNTFLSLLFFNIGVEIGQIFFILLILILYRYFHRFVSISYLQKSKIVFIYMIGTISSYWLIENIITSFNM